MQILPSRRILSVACAASAAVALLTGCSSSGLTAREESLGGPSPAPATNMPDAAALTPAGSVVPAGEWAVVELSDSSETPAVTTIAIRSGAVRQGSPDDLADVQVMNGTSDSTTGTPYYVNYSWVLLEGSENSSPIQRVSALNSATGDTGNTLLVPDEYEKCTDRPTGQFENRDVINVACSVNVFAGEAGPDRLVFDGDPGDYTGSKAVQLALG
ncbi:hypothetical protein [Subtercola boreus]|uniref:Uncharacterized protein n=1 Tax=Subtercola boreus TaxID=120213 RepID=A0A3E0WBE7_9MICO|nr:hypothetical protein [Subtercola boreus]RFA21182.1 hypothetical protein B7R24_07270 [Subtercola boreus]RFA21565.1 hypothetical protein B7R23_07215 [Subtercola boreus]RFA27535.1 hypothetical protein B7R25_07340 [Subtercola boreus]